MDVLSPARDGAEALRLEPGRLWSLWDMLRISARNFYYATSELTSLAALVNAKARGDDPLFTESTLLSAEDVDILEAKLKRILLSVLPPIGAIVTSIATNDARV